jgi:hypothetical protein
VQILPQTHHAALSLALEKQVILHVGDTAVVKLWRFDPSKIQNEVEAMLIGLLY